MKVKASIQKRCEHCYLVKRAKADGKKIVYIYCKRNPRHKQKQG